MSLIFGMVDIATRFFAPSDYMETLCYLQLCLLTKLHFPDGWPEGAEVAVLFLDDSSKPCYSSHPPHFLGGNKDCSLGSMCFQSVVSPKYKSLLPPLRLPLVPSKVFIVGVRNDELEPPNIHLYSEVYVELHFRLGVHTAQLLLPCNRKWRRTRS